MYWLEKKKNAVDIRKNQKEMKTRPNGGIMTHASFATKRNRSCTGPKLTKNFFEVLLEGI